MADSNYISVIKRKYYLTPKGVEYLAEQLEAGRSYKSLGEELGVNPDTLSILCKTNNIARDNRRTFTINHNYFNQIDTKEKAYWLGFFAADGYISESKDYVSLGLQSRDKEHIEKFLKAIGSNKPVKMIKTNKQQYDQAYVAINSTQMVSDLKRHGVFQNKSLLLKYPSDDSIPKDLQIYWILGYFDGDGSINSWQDGSLTRFRTSFTGTEDVLNGINTYLGNENNLHKEHKCENGTMSLAYTEGKSKQWLDRAYDNESIKFCLERKYQLYQSVLIARDEK